MTSNLLCLNPSKTKYMLIGIPKQIYKIPKPPLSNPPNLPITPTDSARNPNPNPNLLTLLVTLTLTVTLFHQTLS